jgi:tetratricopeptide (TPR) repeat protein
MNLVNKKLLPVLLAFVTLAVFPQAAKMEQAFLDNAQGYFEKGELDKTIAELDKAIGLNPRSAKAFTMRADCKTITRDMEGAVRDYTKAIELGPNAPGIEKAYNNRGVARQYLGNDINAFSDFERAIQINPNYADPYNGRGVLLDKRGRTDFALKDYNRAILLDPFGSAAYTGRGNIEFRRNDLAGALADYDKSIELFPVAAASYIIRGTIHGLRNKWELALADLREGFEMNRDPGQIGAGILGVALADVDKYVAAYPKNARAYAARGFINLLRKRKPEADKDFQKSFQLDPKLKKDLTELIDSVKGRMEAVQTAP